MANFGPIQRVEHIMGMPIILDVRDSDADPASAQRVFDWLRFVDATFSTYKSESDISRLNRGELSLGDVDPTVLEVLDRCDELYAETDGYFDIRAPYFPMAETNQERIPIDPSGLVKGWSVARAGQLLDSSGARNYAIYAGGDIVVRGAALPDAVWRIGVQHPLLRDKVAAVIHANNLAIATSGTYERGEHIINPHTAQAPHGVLSVTITGPDLATADAYATAAFAMGINGPAWTARLVGYEAMTILADQTVRYTMNFPSV